MATVILDDLDGLAGARPVHFWLDNISYEIDLSDVNLCSFDEALRPWVQHARRPPISGRLVGASTRGANPDVDLRTSVDGRTRADTRSPPAAAPRRHPRRLRAAP
jgi:hypothetical protein